MPQSVRESKRRYDSLVGMLYRQKNISARNIKQASTWVDDPDSAVATLAQLLVDIGRAHPRKRKRLGHLRNNHPEVWCRMVAAGLVCDWPDDSFDSEPPFDSDPPFDAEPPFEWAPVDEPTD